MILFFKTPQGSVIATDVDHQLDQQEVSELCWLYGDATLLDESELEGIFGSAPRGRRGAGHRDHRDPRARRKMIDTKALQAVK